MNSENTSGDSFLSPADAAALLSCSERHLYRRVKSGSIPAQKDGRRVLIRRTAIDAYVASLPAAKRGA